MCWRQKKNAGGSQQQPGGPQRSTTIEQKSVYEAVTLCTGAAGSLTWDRRSQISKWTNSIPVSRLPPLFGTSASDTPTLADVGTPRPARFISRAAPASLACSYLCRTRLDIPSAARSHCPCCLEFLATSWPRAPAASRCTRCLVAVHRAGPEGGVQRRPARSGRRDCYGSWKYAAEQTGNVAAPVVAMWRSQRDSYRLPCSPPSAPAGTPSPSWGEGGVGCWPR